MSKIEHTTIKERSYESVETICKKIDEAGGWPSWATELQFEHVVENERPTIWSRNGKTQDGTSYFASEWWTPKVTIAQYKEYKTAEWKKANPLMMQAINEAIKLAYDAVTMAKSIEPSDPVRRLDEAANLARQASEKLKTAATMSFCNNDYHF